ncbi:DNA-binding protein [Streptantibioticus cattleyicolor NRRL 8057 = DSM 46488]|nr:DNA-binding protein [Streptantibioticus cattleyicolor NRRL 8057 = DSM 46488]
MRMYGALVRHLRTRQKISLERLAAHCGYSKSLVAAIETGIRMPSMYFIRKAAEILGEDALLMELAEHLSRDTYPHWFLDYLDLERRARAIHSYQAHVLPGLLQTEETARAVLSAYRPVIDDKDIEERVAGRMARQTIFDRKPTPVLSFVLELITITRPIGGPEVHRAQLERLLFDAQRRNVEIQIMPPDRETHSALDGPFTLIETYDNRRLAYVEGQHGSRLIEDPLTVSDMDARYGIIRAQAFSPEESLRLIEQVAKEL